MSMRPGVAMHLGFLLTLLLTSCTTQPQPVPPQARLAVAVTPSEPSKPAVTVTNALSAGGKIGVVAGVGAAFACGPFAYTCMQITVPALGAAGEAASRALYSADTHADDRLERLHLRVAAYEQERTVQARLREAVAARCATRWEVVETGAPTTVAMTIERFALAMTSDERTSLIVVVSVSIDQSPGRQVKLSPPLKFESPAARLELWLDQDGHHLEDTFDRAYEHLAQAIFARLAR